MSARKNAIVPISSKGDICTRSRGCQCVSIHRQVFAVVCILPQPKKKSKGTSETASSSTSVHLILIERRKLVLLSVNIVIKCEIELVRPEEGPSRSKWAKAAGHERERLD